MIRDSYDGCKQYAQNNQHIKALNEALLRNLRKKMQFTDSVKMFYRASSFHRSTQQCRYVICTIPDGGTTERYWPRDWLLLSKEQ